jgi:hypothetical protein
MSAERTPTPWALGGKATIRSAKFPRYVAIMENNSERAANAEFIVRAANCHADLIASLRECVAELEAIDEGKTVRRRAASVLAQAEAKQ